MQDVQDGIMFSHIPQVLRRGRMLKTLYAREALEHRNMYTILTSPKVVPSSYVNLVIDHEILKIKVVHW